MANIGLLEILLFIGLIISIYMLVTKKPWYLKIIGAVNLILFSIGVYFSLENLTLHWFFYDITGYIFFIMLIIYLVWLIKKKIQKTSDYFLNLSKK